MVVAVSLGLAMIPVGLPQVDNTSAILVNFPDNVQAFLNSGITTGSVTAILLNLLLNQFGGGVEHERTHGAKLDIASLNAMPVEDFVTMVSPAYQGSAGIAEYVAGQRPFADANELRAAMQDRLFSMPAEEQRRLMDCYPVLAGQELLAGELGEHSVLDQGSAGLTFLSEEQQEIFDEVTAAYREKFGIPLIVAARELNPEQVLEQAFHRLDNSPTQEHAAALLEIAKIANYRLADWVDGTEPMGQLRSSTMAKLNH
jgi:OHCU decarboxylase